MKFGTQPWRPKWALITSYHLMYYTSQNSQTGVTLILIIRVYLIIYFPIKCLTFYEIKYESTIQYEFQASNGHFQKFCVILFWVDHLVLLMFKKCFKLADSIFKLLYSFLLCILLSYVHLFMLIFIHCLVQYLQFMRIFSQ